jgi:hypothetical protein
MFSGVAVDFRKTLGPFLNRLAPHQWPLPRSVKHGLPNLFLSSVAAVFSNVMIIVPASLAAIFAEHALTVRAATDEPVVEHKGVRVPYTWKLGHNWEISDAGDGSMDGFLIRRKDIPVASAIVRFLRPYPTEEAAIREAFGDGELQTLYVNSGERRWLETELETSGATGGSNLTVCRVSLSEDANIQLLAEMNTAFVPIDTFARGALRQVLDGFELPKGKIKGIGGNGRNQTRNSESQKPPAIVEPPQNGLKSKNSAQLKQTATTPTPEPKSAPVRQTKPTYQLSLPKNWKVGNKKELGFDAFDVVYTSEKPDAIFALLTESGTVSFEFAKDKLPSMMLTLFQDQGVKDAVLSGKPYVQRLNDRDWVRFAVHLKAGDNPIRANIAYSPTKSGGIQIRLVTEQIQSKEMEMAIEAALKGVKVITE